MKMVAKKGLFDDHVPDGAPAEAPTTESSETKREVLPLDRLINLEAKITAAVEKVKALKEEKSLLERKIRELETLLNDKNNEIESLRSEKKSIGSQIEELLSELETLET